MADEVDEAMNEVSQRRLPDSIANDLDSSDQGWHDRYLEQKLQEDQDRERAIQQQLQQGVDNIVDTWHGANSSVGSLRDQVSSGVISPSDFFSMTGRIYAGNARGSGTAMPGGDPLAGALETDPHAVRADTSGLDALDAFQAQTLGDTGGGGGGDPFAGALENGAQPASGGVSGPTPGHAMAGSFSFLTSDPIKIPPNLWDSRPTFYGGNQTGPGISSTDRATAASMLSNDRAAQAASNQQRLKQGAGAQVPTDLVVNLPGIGPITIPSAAGMGVSSAYRTNSPAQAPTYYKR